MDRLLLIALACAAPPAGSAPSPAPSAPPVATAPAEPPAASAPAAPAPAAPVGGVLPDACEPSALVRVGDRWVLGDNETEDRLFVYDATMRPLPSQALPLPVEDIEALAVDGDRTVVVGSHSRNKSGKLKPDRRRIVGLAAGPLTLSIADCPACAAVEGKSPNDGGFNLEGAAMFGGELVLGARAPVPAGKALLFVVGRAPGREGRIERTVELDLGGAGVRELAPFRGGLLVLSGAAVDAATSHRLWFLPALDAKPQDLGVTLPPSTEGIWPRDDTHLRYVVDGDGETGACTTPGTWGEIELPPASR